MSATGNSLECELGNAGMTKEAKKVGRFLSKTSNTCACLSGAVFALVGANHFLPQYLGLEPSLRSDAVQMSRPADPVAMVFPKPAITPASVGETEPDGAERLNKPQEKPLPPWGVHLTASWSRDKALSQYSAIQRKFDDVLPAGPPMIVRLANHSMGTAERFAVRVGQPGRDEADKLCARLIDAGGACVVYRTTKR